MLGRLTGKVAIVTGAGQGIGEGIAKVFAEAGAKVIIATRSAGNGQAVADSITSGGGEATFIQCDVGSRTEIEQLVARTIDTYGSVDIAIHNAAVYPIHTIEELSDEVLDRTLDVNMKAGVWLTQYCLPEFHKKRWGRIIFTSSVTGPTVAMPGTSHYAMSKGGMNGFIRTAALEFARDGITVNGIEPGYILTKAMSALGSDEELRAMAQCIPMGHLGAPRDIANAMLFLASEEAGYITGQTLIVDGGSTLPESQVVMDGFYQSQD